MSGAVPISTPWSPVGIEVDVDPSIATRWWMGSGCAWLTEEGVAVPRRMVAAVHGLVSSLDAGGAGLGSDRDGGLGILTERAALAGWYAAGRPRSGGQVSCGGATRLVRAADGWLALSLARDSDVELLPAWLDASVGADPWTSVTTLVAGAAVAPLVERAALVGLPCSTVGEVGRTEPVRLTRVGAASPLPLAGALVVNLASLWAGPLAAHVLRRLGARVIDVESAARPDGARATATFHDLLHAGSRSVALRFDDAGDRRRLADLVARADVVIEGSRPRALAQLGIDATTMVEHGPRVWLSITAHGRHGSAGGRVGFGDDAAAAGGLVSWVDGAPRFLVDAVADPLTGLVAAAAAAELLAAGGRHLADVALARCAAWGSASAASSAAERDPVSDAPARVPPRARPADGSARPLGADTGAVLAELGIGGTRVRDR